MRGFAKSGHSGRASAARGGLRRSALPTLGATRNHPANVALTCRSRFRASARALVLFAARRRAARLRGSPSSPRPTSSRRWRSPTPTTCSARWNSPKSSPAPASSRSSAARCAIDFGDSDHGQRKPNARRRAPRIVLLAAQRGRLPQPDAAVTRAPSSTRRPNEPPRLKLDWLEGETDGLIALTGGPGGPLDLRHRRRAEPSRRRAARCAACALFGDRLYVELQRHGIDGRARGRAGADRSRLRQRPAAGRDQRAVFRRPRTTTRRMTR